MLEPRNYKMKTIENTSNGFKNMLTIPDVTEFDAALQIPAQKAKALKFLIAHWRYHVVNPVNHANAEKLKAMKKAKEEGKAYEGKGLQTVQADFLTWLATAEKTREVAEDPMATRLWQRLCKKLGFDPDETSAEERGTDWPADVEIINDWQSRPT